MTETENALRDEKTETRYAEPHASELSLILMTDKASIIEQESIFPLKEEEKQKKKTRINRWRELRNIALLITATSTASFVFINFNLIKIYAHDIFNNEEVEKIHIKKELKPEIREAKAIDETSIANLDSLIETHTSNSVVARHSIPQLEDTMQQRLEEYNRPFNILPPQNLLVINDEEITVSAPIIADFTKTPEQIAKGDFKTELKEGVIQFPGTPNPGTKGGHTIIAGHSSTNFVIGEDDPFGTIFAKLHKLEPGDTFTIIQDGRIHKYKTLGTEIIRPKDLEKSYKKRNDFNKYGSLVSLVSCYPPGTTSKRFILTAKEITSKSYHQ